MSGWARAILVVVCAMLLIGVMYYGFMQFRMQLAKLQGKEVEEVSQPKTQLPIQLIQAAVAVSIISAFPLIAWKIHREKTRIFGVVRPSDFNRHILLFGPTGSGKTSTALRAIELALSRRVPVEVLDWKGEYVGKIRGATVVRKFKLLEPIDWSQAEIHAMIVTDILRDVLQLTEPMTYMLYEEVSKMYEERAASFARLVEQLKARRAMAVANRAGAEANIAEGLIRRLLPLVLDERRTALNVRGDGGVVIYDLSELPTYQLRALYAEIVMWRLYNEARGGGSMLGLRKLIVAEEAQNYVRPRRIEQPPSIGERIVNELRAYGYGCLLIAPDPYQLPMHLARDVAAVVSIGYQALPEVVADLLSFYRYANVKRLLRTTDRPRTYIYCDGKLYVKSVPKPYRGVIDLGVEAVEEAVEPVGEEAEKPRLRLEEEEAPEPSGGAPHQSPRAYAARGYLERRGEGGR